MKKERPFRSGAAEVPPLIVLATVLAAVVAIVWICQPSSYRSHRRKQGLKKPAEMVRNLVGQETPNADFRSVETGDRLSLESLRGKVVLLNFWGTWCEPCRRELPELLKIWESLEHDERFQFLAVASGRDSIDSVQAFQAQAGFHFPAYTALNQDVYKAFNLNCYPTNILIDAQGRVRYYHTGFDEANLPELNSLIQELLNELDESEGT